MKKNKEFRALEEVWEWKAEVQNDLENMRFGEKRKYLDTGMKEVEKILGGKFKQNEDGSYTLEIS